MEAIKEKLQQLNGEVKDVNTDLKELAMKVWTNPANSFASSEHHRLVEIAGGAWRRRCEVSHL